MSPLTPAGPSIGQPKQQFSAFRVRRTVFWLVTVTTLLNVNHFLNLTTGTGWPATLGLAFCCIFLCSAVRLPLRHVLGTPGGFIVAALISYIFIGSSVALVLGAPLDTPGYSSLPLRGGLAILVVIATALGASATLLQIGISPLLRGVLVILTATCVLIFMTPLLQDNVYTSLPSRWGSLSFELDGRFSGTFTRPTLAGTAACYTAALAFSFLIYGPYRIFAAMALVLACSAAILTTSRVAIVSLGVLFIFFSITGVLQHGPKRGVASLWTLIPSAVGVIVLTVISLGPPVLKQIIFRRGLWLIDSSVRTHTGASMNNRFELWPLALSRILESPLFGHGIAQFHRLAGAQICQLGLPCGSHNAYLMLWGEAGVIPPLLHVLGIGSLLWTCWRLPRSLATSTVAGWTLVFSLASMVRDGEPYFVWNCFILGLSCVLVAHATREARRPRSGSSETEPASP